MDKFELYMIDTIKIWADKVRKEENEEIKWMEKNVLAELMSALVKYESTVNGEEVNYNEFQEDFPLDVA